MMESGIDSISAVNIDSCRAIEVGPGCYRRAIAELADVRIWSVDILPGSEWPHVDQHDELGEHLFVIAGELIEGEQRFPAGSYVQYGSHSSHRPRSEVGATLLGFNLIPGSSTEKLTESGTRFSSREKSHG